MLSCSTGHVQTILLLFTLQSNSTWYVWKPHPTHEPHPLAAGCVLLQAGAPLLVVLVQIPLAVTAALLSAVLVTTMVLEPYVRMRFRKM